MSRFEGDMSVLTETQDEITGPGKHDQQDSRQADYDLHALEAAMT